MNKKILMYHAKPWGLKIAGIFCFLLLLIGSTGYYCTYQFDHRQAKSLSAYCTIDFRSAPDEKGKLASATLSIVDYRYGNEHLKSGLTLFIDGVPWNIPAVTKQTPPTYSLSPYDGNTSFKNTNKLFVEIPLDALPGIAAAQTVEVYFQYENGTTIKLPLNAPDLQYWKDQLK